MKRVRTQPCEACPYRRDVPSGLWAEEEYAKLEAYDAPTAEQPFATFQCHATPEFYCHGWAVVHTTRGHEYDLLALRFAGCDAPAAAVPLFESGTEAAEHGRRDVQKPTRRAKQAIDKLQARYPRLRKEGAK